MIPRPRHGGMAGGVSERAGDMEGIEIDLPPIDREAGQTVVIGILGVDFRDRKFCFGVFNEILYQVLIHV